MNKKLTCYKNKKRLYSIKVEYIDPASGTLKMAHRYRDKNGFKRKIDAQERALTLRAELEEIPENADTLTLKDVIQMVIDDSKLTMKKSSLDTLKHTLKRIKSIENKSLSSIQPSDIKKIMTEMNDKGLSVNTIDKFYYSLHKVFQYCVDEEILDKNTVSKVKRIKRPGELEEEMAFWRLEEFNMFMIEVTDPLEKTLFSTLFYSGMRKGEALALQWKNIDLEKGTIDIKRALSTSGTKSNPIFTTPKTKNSIRKIRIPSILIDILKEWKTHEENYYCFDDEMLVFGYDNVLSKNTIGTRFRNHCRIGVNETGWTNQDTIQGKLKVGEIVYVKGKVYWRQDKSGGYKEMNTKLRIKSIKEHKYGMNYELERPFPYIVMHGLRHSCVSMMINNLKTQKSVVAMAAHFGHTIEVMLAKYAHFYNESEDELMDEFDSYLKNI